MNKFMSSETFSGPMRKISYYYLGFCLSLILIQVSLVSIVAFFHFLLDHDMAVVENWLNRNAWELFSISKVASLIIIMNVIRLNQYSDMSVSKYISKLNFKVDHQILIFISFIFLADLLLIISSPTRYVLRELEFGVTLLSFGGSALFYLIDMILIVYLMELFPIMKKRNKAILLTLFTIIFLMVTSVIHPYTKVNSLYMILFYSTLMITLFIFPGNLGNLIWLSTTYIGLSCVIFGQDLVWANNYSLITYSHVLPSTSHFICWILGIFYLVKSVKFDSVSHVDTQK